MAAPPAVPDDVVAELGPVLRRKSAPTAASTLTGSVSVVQPKRRTSRPKWVSTVMPGTPKALPSTTLAVLRPTPGSVTSSAIVLRHLAAEPLGERRAQLDQGVGLGPEEAGRLDHLLELGPVGGGVRGGVGIAREDQRRDQIDPLVGALGRQDGGHQQLERGGEVELDVGVGIGRGEDAVDRAGAADQCGPGLVEDESYGRIRGIGSQLGCPPDLLELMPSP